MGLEELADAVLAHLLAHAHHTTPLRNASNPRIALKRCLAWRQTTLRGPSRTEAAISSPRCAGRQCITTASEEAAPTTCPRQIRQLGKLLGAQAVALRRGSHEAHSHHHRGLRQ